MTDEIKLSITGPIAEIVLNQPERRNALNTLMWRAIPELVSEAISHPEVRALIIHGGRSGVFAAGADISEFDTAYADERRILESGGLIASALNALEQCPMPVIAAIDGPCFGAGVSLAVAADIRIAHKSAQFCVPPAKLGLVFPAGDTRRLVGLIGQGAAKYLMLTAKIIKAQEAKQISLVQEVCDKSAVLVARQMAESMAKLSPRSLSAIKLMTAGVVSGWPDDAPEADALFVAGFLGADHAEGRAAFLEKRKPQFSNLN